VTDGQADGGTDGRTDRQTDRILITRPRLHSMQRGINRPNGTKATLYVIIITIIIITIIVIVIT